MSTVMPQIPPRPTRTQEQPPPPSSASINDSEVPKIPPRPVNRRLDRSMSPVRYARSPLNESPFLTNHGNQSKTSLYANDSANTSRTEIGRPPSVNLPSIGQEGNEYADAFEAPAELGTSPTQTRSIANDLHLHAPKPSLPTSSAKQRVSAVTRTDSGLAASLGLGKPSANTSDDKDPALRSLKAKPSFTSQTSNGHERRPSSVADGEHGIPHIGQYVPMYPNAGDVQAPSPAPFAVTGTPGVGFHNDGTKPRNHNRKLSARGHEVSSDAYGRYGHGGTPHDKFEKAYYEKHPELYKKELGQYGDGRPEWAMSSEDLNKIVRDTGSRGPGFGTPTEQVGFQASEEYASRMSSPRLTGGLHMAHPNISEMHVDSPLKQDSSLETTGKAEFEQTLAKSLTNQSGASRASDVEDDNVIHVEAPAHRTSKIYGGYAHAQSTEDLGPHTGQGGEADGIHDEHGYRDPILASDEVAKEPFGWELQPAVSPLNERRGSGYNDDNYHHRSGSQGSSRATSRPGSIHGTLSDFVPPRSTPLEDLDEYEPLFPEDEKNKAETEKPLTAADRLKRPELKNRKFPSQDVWEDSPNSLQYTATVSSPQLPNDEDSEKADGANETAAQAFARRQEELAEKEAKNPDSFLHPEKDNKPWAHQNHLASETRPITKQRFPSRDIWEDTPDSLQLQTTVETPQMEKEAVAPPEERPTTGAVTYHQEKAATGFPLGSEEGRATTGLAAVMIPHVPARPSKSKLSQSADASPPSIPERPKQIKPTGGIAPRLPLASKPQIPARPAKPLIKHESSENVPLSKVASDSSEKSIDSEQGASGTPKAKPPVPSRPLGSKIAALQGGFMSDLNKRLQLGPQAPKKDEATVEEPEQEKEKAPLVDARKGRARGPARRAPAKSPAPAVSSSTDKPSGLSFSMTSTLWSINEDDSLYVASHQKEEPTPAKSTPVVHAQASPFATNTAGESQHDSSEAVPKSTDLAPSSSAAEDDHSAQAEQAEKHALAADVINHDSEPTKLSDDPEVRESKPSGAVSKEVEEEAPTKMTEPKSADAQSEESHASPAVPTQGDDDTIPGAFPGDVNSSISKEGITLAEQEAAE